MEPNNIDSVFRKMISDSKGYYNTEANIAKEQIWNQLGLHENKSKPLMFRLLVAACILLFISTSVMFFINYKTHNTIKVLTELNTDLENKFNNIIDNDLKNDKSLIAASIVTTDTIYIEKMVMVTKPIIQTVKITDTVFFNQIVYVEKEADLTSELIVDNNLTTDSIFQILLENYETEIIINSNVPIKKKKKRKFQFKFGGSKTNENDGNLALSSKL